MDDEDSLFAANFSKKIFAIDSAESSVLVPCGHGFLKTLVKSASSSHHLAQRINCETETPQLCYVTVCYLGMFPGKYRKFTI